MRDRELSDKQRKMYAALWGAVFVVFAALICWLVGRPMLKFVSKPEFFRDWVDNHGIWGRLAYLLMVMLQVFVAVIPGEPLEIGGGYAFGAFEGTALCMLGATVGSIIVFLFVRRFGIRFVEAFFPREKIRSLRFLQSSKRRDILFLLIFMIPGTPKDLLCYFAGLTDMRFGAWLLISSFGRIPSIITSTIGGNALGLKNYWFAVIVFAVTMLISLTGLFIYQRIGRRHEMKRQDTNDEAGGGLSD